MNKKNTVIIICLVLTLVLHCGIYAVHDNYLLGREIRVEAGDLLLQCDQVKQSIDDLKQQFDNGSAEPDRSYYDLALHSLRYFGYENVPVLEDVRQAWIIQLEQLYQETMSDEALKAYFTDNQESVEFWQNQLQNLMDCLNAFIERYDQMSGWEQNFTSWNNERKILSEQVRLP